MSLRAHLQSLGVDLVTLLEQLDDPVALVDAAGTVLWQNAAAIAFVGDLRGAMYSAIPTDYHHHARTAMAERTLGGRDEVTHRSFVIIDVDGQRRRVETVAISVKRGSELVGVLGIVRKIYAEAAGRSEPRLTPRQTETLRLLAAGLSTEEIAESLGIARETARNYARQLLKELGVRSRLEAVVRAREVGLL